MLLSELTLANVVHICLRSILWECNLELKDFVAGALAPRIGNDVSYVTRITHEIHLAWQAQYLLRLEVDFA